MYVLLCVFCFAQLLCIICLQMCTVLLPPSVSLTADNKIYQYQFKHRTPHFAYIPYTCGGARIFLKILRATIKFKAPERRYETGKLF